MKSIIQSCKLVTKISKKKGTRYYALVLDLGYTQKSLFMDLNTFSELLGMSCQEAYSEISSVNDFSVNISDLLVDVENI